MTQTIIELELQDRYGFVSDRNPCHSSQKTACMGHPGDYRSDSRLLTFVATVSSLMSTPTYEIATLPDLSIKYVAGNAFNE
jgi:hypothetical protein